MLIKGLVPRPLHRKVFLWVAIIVWALNFIHVLDVPIVSINPLARLKHCSKKIDVVLLTSRVGSADPHQISCEIVDPELVLERGLPHVFMGC